MIAGCFILGRDRANRVAGGVGEGLGERIGIKVMSQYFPHEKLDVQKEALVFATLADELLLSWPASWAVHDQLDRAVDSILTKLAKAARLRATGKGIYIVECSLGSVLECAACFDVAWRRRLVDAPRVHSTKELLRRIARMLAGLCTSWKGRVKEEAGTKLAAYLDLVAGALPREVDQAKSYLREVLAMSAGLREYLRE